MLRVTMATHRPTKAAFLELKGDSLHRLASLLSLIHFLLRTVRREWTQAKTMLSESQEEVNVLEFPRRQRNAGHSYIVVMTLQVLHLAMTFNGYTTVVHHHTVPKRVTAIK